MLMFRSAPVPVIFFGLLFFLISIQSATAQVYRRTAGIRMDDQSFGLSMVQRIAKPVTIEGILDFRKQDISVAIIPGFIPKSLADD